VNSLEGAGATEDLLDALINRGCVLSMMGHYVSALSDFDDAAEIVDMIEGAEKDVDAGTYVKLFVSKGEIQGGECAAVAAEDYSRAASRLRGLSEDSRYYDGRKTVHMCVKCCEDLVDKGFPLLAAPFIEKAYSLLSCKDDDWSRNRFAEVLNLEGTTLFDTDEDRAAECFSASIDAGTALLEAGCLDDMMTLVFPFISRGDVFQRKGMIEPYMGDRKAAITLLEEMLGANRLDDVHVLAKLHQDMANTYLTLNKVKEAEEHLVKDVVLNMNGAREYIREFVRRGA
jgi:tetratricopeptide (TPR) repeat protein